MIHNSDIKYNGKPDHINSTTLKNFVSCDKKKIKATSYCNFDPRSQRDMILKQTVKPSRIATY